MLLDVIAVAPRGNRQQQQMTSLLSGETSLERVVVSPLAASSKKRPNESDETTPPSTPPRRQRQKTTTTGPPTMKRIVLHDLRETEDESYLTQALKSLLQEELFEEDNEDHAKEFFRLGGHLAVVRVMNEQERSKAIQLEGIRVLRTAAYSNPELRTAIASVEGIEAILHAMKLYSIEQEIVEQGFGALMNLTFESEGNAVLLVARLSSLIELMKLFSSHADIQKCACGMLENLCSFPDLTRQITKAGALGALATAIERHEDNSDVQDFGLKAMKLLVPSLG